MTCSEQVANEFDRPQVFKLHVTPRTEERGEMFPDLQSHLALVKSIARRLHRTLPSSVLLEDLISAGNEGLAAALTSFKPDRGAQFSTYASHRIRGAMLDSLRMNDPGSRYLRARQRAMEMAEHLLTSRHGRTPDAGEVARELGIGIQELFELKGDVHNLASERNDCLEKTSQEESGVELLPSPEDGPLTLCLRSEQRDSLIVAIDTLPERLRLVISLKYVEELKNKEIASLLQVGESRISQMHNEAIILLRKRLERDAPSRRAI